MCSAILLNREELPNQAWKDVIAIIQAGKNCEHPFVFSYPSLASFEKSYTEEAECELLRSLASSDVRKVQRSFDSIFSWIQKWSVDHRVPKIPESVISVTIGLMESGNQSWMDHAWHVFEGFLSKFSQDQRIDILRRAARGIDLWAARLQYRGVDRSGETDKEFQAALPDLRESFTKLCKVIVDLKLANVTAEKWLTENANDPMPEIQRVLQGETD